MEAEMKVNTQPYKGARDFYPEDKRKQQWLFDGWKRVVERFGYLEMDAPIMEPTDLYLIKGNQEIIEEQTYTFKDRGDRSVTIRAEMTPSVSRMVAARRQELAYPLRWYSIPNLWRYERMQKGRLREFWQLNVEMFGISSGMAELEMIQVVDALFQEFKAKRTSYVIKVNSRKFVQSILTNRFALNEEQITEVVRLTDKKTKMTADQYMSLLTECIGDATSAAELVALFEAQSLSEMNKDLNKLDGYSEIEQLLAQSASLGIRNCVLDMTLMRGFDYYTNIVFEAFDTGPDNNRSILGGGRYDGLVGQFGVEPVPTIGFAAGDVVFMDFLMSYGLVPELETPLKLAILPVDQACASEAARIAATLRDNNIRNAVDFTDRKIDKKIKAAIKSGVQNVLVVGQKEIESEKYTLKDLRSGKELVYALPRIIQYLQD
jgi:histidyl-tRNA synthetase